VKRLWHFAWLASLALVALLELTATAALADPVRVTDGRAYFQTGDGTDMHFQLRADAVRADGEVFGDEPRGSYVLFGTPEHFADGATASASSRWIMPYANSTDSPGIEFWTGEFAFRSVSALLSCEPVGDLAACSGQAPFTFTGKLAGFDSQGQQQLAQAFIGRGQASAYFEESGLSAINYQFQDTAAVPEPGTLLLVASGAAAVSRRATKGRRKSAALWQTPAHTLAQSTQDRRVPAH
jgi:hypothetical protein